MSGSCGLQKLTDIIAPSASYNEIYVFPYIGGRRVRCSRERSRQRPAHHQRSLIKYGACCEGRRSARTSRAGFRPRSVRASLGCDARIRSQGNYSLSLRSGNASALPWCPWTMSWQSRCGARASYQLTAGCDLERAAVRQSCSPRLWICVDRRTPVGFILRTRTNSARRPPLIYGPSCKFSSPIRVSRSMPRVSRSTPLITLLSGQNRERVAWCEYSIS